MTTSTPTPDPPHTIYFFNGRIGYTPHIYTKEDWKKHKGIFIGLQLAPLILMAIDGFRSFLLLFFAPRPHNMYKF